MAINLAQLFQLNTRSSLYGMAMHNIEKMAPMNDAERIIALKGCAIEFFREADGNAFDLAENYISTINNDLDGLTPLQAVNNPKYGLLRAASLLWLATPE